MKSLAIAGQDAHLESITQLQDPRFIPGILKFGGLQGLVQAQAATDLWFHDDEFADWLDSDAGNTQSSATRTISHGDQDPRTLRELVVDWILSRVGE